jgi:hypothetical protein
MIKELPNGARVFVERFELLAWAASEQALIDKLS